MVSYAGGVNPSVVAFRHLVSHASRYDSIAGGVNPSVCATWGTLPHSPSSYTTRSAAVFPPESGPLVVSPFHTVSSLVTYLESFAIVHWCYRKPSVTLYRPESSSVSPSISAEPPWSTASPFRWLHWEKRGQPVRKCLGIMLVPLVWPETSPSRRNRR